MFDLRGEGDLAAMERHAERGAICARVGNVDATQFLVQLADHRPSAMRVFRDTGCSTRDAWQRAVCASQRTHAMRARHPCDALCAVAMRFVCWGASTSGVESTFSKQKRALGDIGFGRDAGYLNDHLQIMETRPGSDDEKLVQLARQEWLAVYGSARASGTTDRVPHMHKGIPCMKPKHGVKSVIAAQGSSARFG